jgi:hypothetical protein
MYGFVGAWCKYSGMLRGEVAIGEEEKSGGVKSRGGARCWILRTAES